MEPGQLKSARAQPARRVAVRQGRTYVTEWEIRADGNTDVAAAGGMQKKLIHLCRETGRTAEDIGGLVVLDRAGIPIAVLAKPEKAKRLGRIFFGHRIQKLIAPSVFDQMMRLLMGRRWRIKLMIRKLLGLWG